MKLHLCRPSMCSIFFFYVRETGHVHYTLIFLLYFDSLECWTEDITFRSTANPFDDVYGSLMGGQSVRSSV